MDNNFKLMCFHVVLAIFVIIFALSLHIIDNAYDYSIQRGGGGNVNWGGLIVNGAFMYDVVLYLLIAFQLVVIIMILFLYYKKNNKRP